MHCGGCSRLYPACTDSPVHRGNLGQHHIVCTNELSYGDHFLCKPIHSRRSLVGLADKMEFAGGHNLKLGRQLYLSESASLQHLDVCERDSLLDNVPKDPEFGMRLHSGESCPPKSLEGFALFRVRLLSYCCYSNYYYYYYYYFGQQLLSSSVPPLSGELSIQNFLRQARKIVAEKPPELESVPMPKECPLVILVDCAKNVVLWGVAELENDTAAAAAVAAAEGESFDNNNSAAVAAAVAVQK